MNFNFSSGSTLNSEYDLLRTTTEEMINLYGIHIKYILTTKVNQDILFGEGTHIKIDNEAVHEFFVKPEETSNWEGDNSLFSKFGLQSLDTINIFVGRTDMESIHPELVQRQGKAEVNNLPLGNLVQFDSNKLMEVTHFDLTSDTLGNNNVFDSNRTKNVYKLTLKSYIFNSDDTSSAQDISNSDKVEYTEFGNLEEIFRDEELHTEEQTERTPRVKEDESNPFGLLG